jgi:hypothetical protein
MLSFGTPDATDLGDLRILASFFICVAISSSIRPGIATETTFTANAATFTHCQRARVTPARDAGVDAESHALNLPTPHHAPHPAAVTIAAPRSLSDNIVMGVGAPDRHWAADDLIR